MGLLPHTSPPEVYASEYYKQDFLRYSERLGVEGIEFRKLLPSIFLPTYLKHQLGYSHARDGLDAGAQRAHGDQPRLRQLRADAEAQRHGGDARRDELRRRPAVVPPAQRGRDALPVRAARRGPVASGRASRRARRLQAPRRRRRERPTRREFFDQTALRELHGRQIDAVELPRRRVRAAVRPAARRTRG